MNVYILGASTSKFGELWDVSPRKLARETSLQALAEARITPSSVQALFVGNMLSGLLGNQQNLGSFYSEELHIKGGACTIEGACASGGLAFHAGVNAVLSGQYETVLVLGIEKMTDHKPEEIARALMSAGTDVERSSGLTFPGLYALIAKAYMEKYGATTTMLASVAVKNHFHASFNPNAQFQKKILIEDVQRSACVADPLRMLDCSPISDGASAVILSSKRPKTKKAVLVAASSVGTDSLGLSERSDITTLSATVFASNKAYKIAQVGPSDIDVAEVHDCFSIAEIVALEDLGFYPKGTAGERALHFTTQLGGKGVIVNTSGGLKACGHPVGATGVKQIAELYTQLQNKAGARQVKNARVGLAHNVGGSGGTAVVSILKTV
jgi:acetyl-CoA C-acetyltransferase